VGARKGEGRDQLPCPSPASLGRDAVLGPALSQRVPVERDLWVIGREVSELDFL
jgi:hypothetical protein